LFDFIFINNDNAVEVLIHKQQLQSLFFKWWISSPLNDRLLMLALLVNKALLNKTAKAALMMEFVWSGYKLRCGVLLKHGHIILHINIIGVHYWLDSLNWVRFRIQFIGILYVMLVLGVDITQMNVKNIVALLIEVALRHIIRSITLIQGALTVIALLIKP
jgi:hypothetical protein